MLTKIKIPISSIANAILAMDSSALDYYQVVNLIICSPFEEEIEMVKNYNGDKELLGKCEQLFLELMKVPHVESKLRLFALRLTFTRQVENLNFKLNALNNFAKEIRGCAKLRLILKTLVSLGNPFNRGNTSMVASSIKLEDVEPSTPERIAFMHHIHTILAERKPELLEFSKDLPHLGPASKLRLRDVAEDMNAVIEGLENVRDDIAAAMNEDVVSSGFQKALMSFSDMAEAETNLVHAFYSVVGRNVDALTVYLLDDPARYPFERVVGAFLDITNILARGKSGKVVHTS